MLDDASLARIPLLPTMPESYIICGFFWRAWRNFIVDLKPLAPVIRPRSSDCLVSRATGE
jgi:hypothetical protein